MTDSGGVFYLKFPSGFKISDRSRPVDKTIFRRNNGGMINTTTPQAFDPEAIRGGEADIDMVFPSGVRVGRTSYGLGLFSFAFIPAGTPIGRIHGTVIHDPDYHSDYCIDIGEDCVLEPSSPFCYLNHSCEPNCILMHYVAEEECDGSEIEGNLGDDSDGEEDEDDECFFSDECPDEPEDEEEDDEIEDELPHFAEVWVETLRDILPNEELTIDYAWPADRAAKCFCGSERCRGWIVDPQELEQLSRQS